MMEQNAVGHLGWFTRLGVLVVAGLLAAGGPAASMQLEGSTGWFKLDTTMAKDWEVVEVPGDAEAVLLRRANAAAGSVGRYILSLQSRSSSAYDVAISEAARVLEQKRISTDILVVNYNDREDRARRAISRAEQNGFDLILSTGSEATAWLWKNYHDGRLPVVSICAKDPVALGQVKRYDVGTGTNFALTSLNLPVEVQMAYALEVMPALRNLAIIVDGGNKSAVETQAVPISVLARARGIRVLTLTLEGGSATNPLSSEAVGAELKGLVSKAVEAMRLNDIDLTKSLFLITGSTAVFEQMETINAQSSRVPVISMVPETVQAGAASAVLSIGVSFRSNAFLAAVYAANILDGRQKPGDLKIGVVTPPDIAVNFRRAREIGLKIPFNFFESANVIYDNDDNKVRPAELSSK